MYHFPTGAHVNRDRTGRGRFIMYGSAISLIPFFVVIPIALWTKQVIPGLAVGLLTGAYILHPSILGGLSSAIHYVATETATSGNLNLILFLYLFGAFVGLIRVSGGVAGFSEWISRRIKSERGAFSLTWISSLATFMAPDFRIITIAPVVSRIFGRLGVKPERVAYAIDVTSTPLCAVVPLGTAFVGYMVGLMHTSVDHAAPTSGPYRLFLASIPFNFFAWAMLAVGFFLTFFGPANRADPVTKQSQMALPYLTKARHTTALLSAEAGSMELPKMGTVIPLTSAKTHPSSRMEGDMPDPMEEMSDRARPSAANLLVPLALLLALTLGLTYWSGYQQGGHTLFQALEQSNASAAMLQALVLTLTFMFVFYALRKQSISRTMFGFMHGGNEMMSVIVLLVLIWAVSAISADLGFSQFCQREITRFVPHALIVPALFVFGCVISYFIGSSFGTWGMLMPLGFSLAASGAGSLPLIAGAVFASGTFGGFASPLSDNTVAMATVMKLPVMTYANYKTKSAAYTAAGCALLYLGFAWIW